jgi:HEAT repeat protein
VPVAGPGLGDQDATVRARCSTAVAKAASVLAERGLLFADPLPPDQFPPPGRRPTAREKQELERYARQVAADLAALRPLVAALGGQVRGLAALVEDPDLHVCVAANEALETLAEARRRLRQYRESVPRTQRGGEESKDAPRSEDRLLDGLLEAIPALARAVAAKEKDVERRLASLYVLETLADEARPAAGPLVQALKDGNAFIRWGAARALGKMAAPPPAGAAVGLGGVLNDDSADVRLTAYAALQHYGPAAKEAVPALARAAANEDPEGRLLAIHTLAALGKEGKPAAPALVQALSAREVRVRAAAAEVLGKLGPPDGEIAAALRKALNDPEADVRAAASVALLGDD